MTDQLQSMPTLDELAAHPELAFELPRSALLALHTRVVVVLAAITGPLSSMDPDARRQISEDHLLGVNEAAKRLSASKDWLYRHASRLPFTVRVGRQLRFSSVGIDRFIHSRQGRS